MPPAPPPPVPLHPQAITVPISSEILKAKKASLKVVKPKLFEKKPSAATVDESELAKDGSEHS